MAERYPIAREEGKRICLEQVPVVYGPRYTTCHTFIVATGKNGRAPGELDYPSGVAIHEDTHQIFIASSLNDRVEIFSEMGEFLSQLGVGQLFYPYCITIHGDSLYVSSCRDNKFSLTEMCRVRRIGRRGHFDSPRQLTTDHISRVFIADDHNDRICIHDPDLNHLRIITHQFMSHPFDVKVSRDHLYVLCIQFSPCIHVLTLEGDELHYLITSGEGMDVLDPWFSCFDPLNNFAISDNKSHFIRVFSSGANLLHTIGRYGHQQGMFSYPRGVAITPNGRLVCVSWNWNYGLQIFY